MKLKITFAEQLPGCLPEGYTLDSLLTVSQFAIWRQISPLTASRKFDVTAGAIKSGQVDRRIHPRTFLELSTK